MIAIASNTVVGRSKMNAVKLTTEQEDATRQLIKLGKRVQTLSGFAGTGKTTVIRELSERLKNFAVCAYTGKAAQVLRSKGIQSARTIHSLIYKPIKDEMSDQMEFQLIPKGQFPCSGIIIDEGSMVPRDIHEDLLSFDVPLIYVGDHGQLEPITSGKDAGFNLMSKPDIVLSKIHRNAGVIARFAEHLRNGHDARDWDEFEGKIEDEAGTVDIVTPSMLGDLTITEDDQLICAYNKTRVSLNKVVRENLGLKDIPVVGDRIICLQNNKDHFIFNGMQGHIAYIDKKQLKFKSGDHEVMVPYNASAFNNENKPDYDRYVIPFDYAYCVTCHKCVHPDTLVETEQGLLPISWINPEGTVATPTGPKPYSNFVNNPTSSAIKMICEGGYELTTTLDHKIEMWDGSDFVMREMQDVSLGDYMRLKLGVTVEPVGTLSLPSADFKIDVRTEKYKLPTCMTEDFAEFLGLMVADGTIWRTGFRLAKRHGDVVERFRELVKSLFGCEARTFLTGNTETAEVNSVYLSTWLLSLGGLSPNDKDVPTCILQSPSSFHKCFLRGLFEDGCVSEKDFNLEWCSVCPGLRQKVRIMLLRLGIMVGECTTTEHRMYLYGSNAYKFIREIGFVSKWKNERGMVCTRDQEAKTVIPVSKEWTKNTKKKLNRSAYNNAISRGTLSRMNAKEAGLTELLQWHYVKVRSLEYVECPSMCIEVPDGHRFLQNGFPHGNCQGSEFDNVVVVEQRCKMWDHARWAYTAASRAKSRLTWVIDR